MELTIPTEGMYRMWYVKTGVLKKTLLRHSNIFTHSGKQKLPAV